MDTKTRKLSELIREGAAMVDGQCWGDLVIRDGDKTLCCALGAAYYALTGNLPLLVPTVLNTFADYPDVGVDEPLTDWITEHNDQGMTFNEIAEQLEAWGL